MSDLDAFSIFYLTRLDYIVLYKYNNIIQINRGQAMKKSKIIKAGDLWDGAWLVGMEEPFFEILTEKHNPEVTGCCRNGSEVTVLKEEEVEVYLENPKG